MLQIVVFYFSGAIFSIQFQVFSKHLEVKGLFYIIHGSKTHCFGKMFFHPVSSMAGFRLS